MVGVLGSKRLRMQEAQQQALTALLLAVLSGEITQAIDHERPKPNLGGKQPASSSDEEGAK